MKPPLTGITVLDLTQIYNGPYATFLMAQAGADVVKIEPPGGEHLRKRQGASGAHVPFAMLNANKRTLSLNLKSDDGKDLLKRLCNEADVLIENFAPGVMDRLGVGYEVLKKINPRLVYASGSGYGLDGPYRDYPAMDLTVQAMSGAMTITGNPDQDPMKCGPALCDFFGGIHLYSAITTSLFNRERTGEGSLVEVSMMESTFMSLASTLGIFYGSEGQAPDRTGNRHGGLSLAPYNVYPTNDGHIAIIANNDKHWQSLAQALGLSDLLEDPRFETMRERCDNIDALDEAISTVTRSMSKDDIFSTLIEVRVPCAPVRSLEEVVNDPHLHARGMLQWIDHPDYGRLALPTSPLRYQGAEKVEYRPSAHLGEDTQAILKQYLNIDDAELTRLHQEEVIYW